MKKRNPGPRARKIARQTMKSAYRDDRHAARASARFGDRTEVHAFRTGSKVEFTDYTTVPRQLEALIDQGRVMGVLTFYKLTGDEPSKVQLGMMNAGMTIEQTFDLVCTIRRSMMSTLGFIDLADKSLMEERQDLASEPILERSSDPPIDIGQSKHADAWDGIVPDEEKPTGRPWQEISVTDLIAANLSRGLSHGDAAKAAHTCLKDGHAWEEHGMTTGLPRRQLWRCVVCGLEAHDL